MNYAKALNGGNFYSKALGVGNLGKKIGKGFKSYKDALTGKTVQRTEKLLGMTAKRNLGRHSKGLGMNYSKHVNALNRRERAVAHRAIAIGGTALGVAGAGYGAHKLMQNKTAEASIAVPKTAAFGGNFGKKIGKGFKTYKDALTGNHVRRANRVLEKAFDQSIRREGKAFDEAVSKIDDLSKINDVGKLMDPTVSHVNKSIGLLDSAAKGRAKAIGGTALGGLGVGAGLFEYNRMRNKTASSHGGKFFAEAISKEAGIIGSIRRGAKTYKNRLSGVNKSKAQAIFYRHNKVPENLLLKRKQDLGRLINGEEKRTATARLLTATALGGGAIAGYGANKLINGNPPVTPEHLEAFKEDIKNIKIPFHKIRSATDITDTAEGKKITENDLRSENKKDVARKIIAGISSGGIGALLGNLAPGKYKAIGRAVGALSGAGTGVLIADKVHDFKSDRIKNMRHAKIMASPIDVYGNVSKDRQKFNYSAYPNKTASFHGGKRFADAMKKEAFFFIQGSAVSGPKYKMDERTRKALMEEHKHKKPWRVAGSSLASGIMGGAISLGTMNALEEIKGIRLARKGKAAAGIGLASAVAGASIANLIDKFKEKKIKNAAGYQPVSMSFYDLGHRSEDNMKKFLREHSNYVYNGGKPVVDQVHIKLFSPKQVKKMQKRQ